MQWVGCNVTELETGLLIFKNVALPEGIFSEIYLGPGGVCAVIQSSVHDPQAMYSALRSLLGTVRVRLFLGHNQQFDPLERTFTELPDGCLGHIQVIEEYITSEPCVNAPEKIRLMREQLIYIDAHTRGYYRDENGTLFLRHGSSFHPVSDQDSEHLLRVMLFGGFLGLHRFAIGKYMSGILYLFTCGCFLLGWVLDLLQFLTGTLRDKSKSLILPPENRQRAFLLCLPALAMGACAMILYTQLISYLLELGSNSTALDSFLVNILSTYGF